MQISEILQIVQLLIVQLWFWIFYCGSEFLIGKYYLGNEVLWPLHGNSNIAFLSYIPANFYLNAMCEGIWQNRNGLPKIKGGI